MTQNPLVDTTARLRLAALARQLAAGAITNDSFEAQCPDSQDPAVRAIAYYGIWPLYDDFIEHRLEGHWALDAEGRRRVARMVLFLRSGCPYRYPDVRGWARLPHLLLSILTLGWFDDYWRRRQWSEADESVWPFYARSEYEAALRNPLFFNGAMDRVMEPDGALSAAGAGEQVA